MKSRLNCTHNPVYLRVTLDRSLTYKYHIANTKATIRTTALALCFSAAEYVSPEWSRSAHGPKIEPVLNSSCRAITGCLRPTKVEDLYLLCNIAPPHILRLVLSQKETDKRENNPLHPLFQQQPVGKRLKSILNFLHTVEPLKGNTKFWYGVMNLVQMNILEAYAIIQYSVIVVSG